MTNLLISLILFKSLLKGRETCRFGLKKKSLTLLKDLRVRFQNDESFIKQLSQPTVRLYPEKACCAICRRKTNLLKTSSKRVYSFYYGMFTLIEGFYYCTDHKYQAKDRSDILKYHSKLATELVTRRHRVAMDLVVKIGLLHYRDHRQLEEIKAFLNGSAAKIDLPISTLGAVSRRFLEY